jgi:hypothetical protein
MADENEAVKELSESIELDPREKLLQSLALKGKSLTILVVVCCVLVGALVLKAFELPPVYVVPGADRETETIRNQVPLNIVGTFAQNFLMRYNNYGPGNVEEAFEGIESICSTKIQARVRSEVAKNIAKIKENSIEHSLVLLGKADVVKFPGKNAYVVMQKGNFKRYVGESRIRDEYRMYEVVVEQGVPSAKNFYGLYIYSEDNIEFSKYMAKMEARDGQNEAETQKNLEKLDEQ